jgi:hypothetical protein
VDRGKDLLLAPSRSEVRDYQRTKKDSKALYIDGGTSNAYKKGGKGNKKVFKENMLEIYDGLKERGLNDGEIIDIVLPTMVAESGSLLPSEKQDVGRGKSFKYGESIKDEKWFSKVDKSKYGRGTGLIQWDDRRHSLKTHAENKGNKWDDMEAQLDFLKAEMTGKVGTEKKNWQRTLAKETPEERLSYFGDKFIRAGKLTHNTKKGRKKEQRRREGIRKGIHEGMQDKMWKKRSSTIKITKKDME